VTIPTQDMLDRAFEAGRTAERVMAEIRRGASPAIENPSWNTSQIVRAAAAKAVDTPKAPKAPVVARGVKAAPKTRTKGVKSAIAGLITAGPITVDGIIERTGFKKNSVISTLMDLKKKGVAMQDGKAWISMGHDSGNSETGAYAGS